MALKFKGLLIQTQSYLFPDQLKVWFLEFFHCKLYIGCCYNIINWHILSIIGKHQHLIIILPYGWRGVISKISSYYWVASSPDSRSFLCSLREGLEKGLIIEVSQRTSKLQILIYIAHADSTPAPDNSFSMMTNSAGRRLSRGFSSLQTQ